MTRRGVFPIIKEGQSKNGEVRFCLIKPFLFLCYCLSPFHKKILSKYFNFFYFLYYIANFLLLFKLKKLLKNKIFYFFYTKYFYLFVFLDQLPCLRKKLCQTKPYSPWEKCRWVQRMSKLHVEAYNYCCLLKNDESYSQGWSGPLNLNSFSMAICTSDMYCWSVGLRRLGLSVELFDPVVYRL